MNLLYETRITEQELNFFETISYNLSWKNEEEDIFLKDQTTVHS